MFDSQPLRLVPRPPPPADEACDDFAERCREPAERWMLMRRRARPAPPPTTLPRVVRA